MYNSSCNNWRWEIVTTVAPLNFQRADVTHETPHMKPPDFLDLIDSTVARIFEFAYRSELSKFERHQIEKLRKNILVKKETLGTKLAALSHLEQSSLLDCLNPTQEEQLLEIKWIVGSGIESVQGTELISIATKFDTVFGSCLSSIQKLESSELPGEPSTPPPEPEGEASVSPGDPSTDPPEPEDKA